MTSRGDGKWFFVAHLQEENRPDLDKRFEIQVLDAVGRAACCGYVGYVESGLVVDGRVIPDLVLEAARRQPIGKGDYVDVKGHSIPPF